MSQQTNTFQNRQGDIFFEEIDSLPKNVKRKKDNILAYGEVTGHAHRITTSLDNVDSYIDENGDIYLQSNDGEIVVDHEEHGAITLPSGTMFRVSRQREYDPHAESKERIVAD